MTTLLFIVLVDFCEPDPCKNNGMCVSGESTFVCTCKDGFSGEDCGETGESLHLNVRELLVLFGRIGHNRVIALH